LPPSLRAADQILEIIAARRRGVSQPQSAGA
jgi:hypothetical protein